MDSPDFTGAQCLFTQQAFSDFTKHPGSVHKRTFLDSLQMSRLKLDQCRGMTREELLLQINESSSTSDQS